MEHLSSVVDPHKVKVLILTDQRTVYQDFYFIMKFVNIVKLDLSYNKIVAFNVGFSFAGFPNLRTLFLHYNRFNSLKSLQVVSEVVLCTILVSSTLVSNIIRKFPRRDQNSTLLRKLNTIIKTNG